MKQPSSIDLDKIFHRLLLKNSRLTCQLDAACMKQGFSAECFALFPSMIKSYGPPQIQKVGHQVATSLIDKRNSWSKLCLPDPQELMLSGQTTLLRA